MGARRVSGDTGVTVDPVASKHPLYRLPGGTFRVEDYERVISHEAVGAPELPAPLLHPVWVMLGVLRGMGVSLGDILSQFGTSEEGTLFGEAGLDQLHPLKSGTEYRVEGEVTDVVRRHGKRMGQFDVLTIAFRILTSNAELVATASQAFVIPRGDG